MRLQFLCHPLLPREVFCVIHTGSVLAKNKITLGRLISKFDFCFQVKKRAFVNQPHHCGSDLLDLKVLDFKSLKGNLFGFESTDGQNSELQVFSQLSCPSFQGW